MTYTPKKNIDPLIRAEFSKIGKKGWEVRKANILARNKKLKAEDNKKK